VLCFCLCWLIGGLKTSTFFIQRLQTFFLFLSRFLRFFNVFLIFFSGTFFYIYTNNSKQLSLAIFVVHGSPHGTTRAPFHAPTLRPASLADPLRNPRVESVAIFNFTEISYSEPQQRLWIGSWCGRSPRKNLPLP